MHSALIVILLVFPFSSWSQDLGGVGIPELPTELPGVDVPDVDLLDGIDPMNVAKNLGKKAIDFFTGGLGGDLIGGGDAEMLSVLRDIKKESADLRRIMEESKLKKGIKALRAAHDFSSAMLDVHRVGEKTYKSAVRLNRLANDPRVSNYYIERLERELKGMERHLSRMKKLGQLYLGVGQEMNAGQRAKGLSDISETIRIMEVALDEINIKIGLAEQALRQTTYFGTMVLSKKNTEQNEFYKKAAEKLRSQSTLGTSGVFHGTKYQETVDIFMDLAGMVLFFFTLYIGIMSWTKATPLVEYKYMVYIILGYVIFRTILF